MKTSIKTHSIWGVAAAGMFALGYLLARPDGNGAAGSGTRGFTLEQNGVAAGEEGAGPAGRRIAPRSGAAGANKDGKAPLLDQKEIDALVLEASSDPNPLTRNLAFSRLLESLTPENAAQLLASMQSNRASGQQMQLFLYAWGAKDSAGAMAHSESLEGREQLRFRENVLSGWAGKNPEAAIAWVNAQGDEESQSRYRSSLVGGLADNNINVATDYVMTRAAAGDKNAAGYMEIVTQEEIRKSGPSGAVSWGDQLPDGPMKAEALNEIAGDFARDNPRAATAWAEKYADSNYGRRVVGEVSEELSERDPKAALTWLDSIKEGEARSDGTYAALREWTRRDPSKASEYLAAMPASGSRDSAVGGFVRSLAREDPESAIIWANTISNQQSRVETLTQAAQTWYRRDPAAAATWLESSPLPQAARQTILLTPARRRD